MRITHLASKLVHLVVILLLKGFIPLQQSIPDFCPRQLRRFDTTTTVITSGGSLVGPARAGGSEEPSPLTTGKLQFLLQRVPRLDGPTPSNAPATPAAAPPFLCLSIARFGIQAIKLPSEPVERRRRAEEGAVARRFWAGVVVRLSKRRGVEKARRRGRRGLGGGGGGNIVHPIEHTCERQGSHSERKERCDVIVIVTLVCVR